MITTKLSTEDQLPLTCTRSGTCCHGKLVMLNPWELANIAREKKITPVEFRDRYCELGGIRLRFDGKTGWKGQPACSQYDDKTGCSVHSGRPLACRLYPLGRQIQSEKVHYMYLGNEFPCMDGCPEVTGLPYMTVAEYLKGQLVTKFGKAQDEYLDLMQNLADIAFELLLDTGLAESGDTITLPLWRKAGNESPEELAISIGQDWMQRLMLPEITDDLEDPVEFAHKHNDLLRQHAQEQFGALQTNQGLHEASVLIMRLALHLARGIGADPKILAEHWIATAVDNGASDGTKLLQ